MPQRRSPALVRQKAGTPIAAGRVTNDPRNSNVSGGSSNNINNINSGSSTSRRSGGRRKTARSIRKKLLPVLVPSVVVFLMVAMVVLNGLNLMHFQALTDVEKSIKEFGFVVLTRNDSGLSGGNGGRTASSQSSYLSQIRENRKRRRQNKEPYVIPKVVQELPWLEMYSTSNINDETFSACLLIKDDNRKCAVQHTQKNATIRIEETGTSPKAL